MIVAYAKVPEGSTILKKEKKVNTYKFRLFELEIEEPGEISKDLQTCINLVKLRAFIKLSDFNFFNEIPDTYRKFACSLNINNPATTSNEDKINKAFFDNEIDEGQFVNHKDVIPHEIFDHITKDKYLRIFTKFIVRYNKKYSFYALFGLCPISIQQFEYKLAEWQFTECEILTFENILDLLYKGDCRNNNKLLSELDLAYFIRKLRH